MFCHLIVQSINLYVNIYINILTYDLKFNKMYKEHNKMQ